MTEAGCNQIMACGSGGTELGSSRMGVCAPLSSIDYNGITDDIKVGLEDESAVQIPRNGV